MKYLHANNTLLRQENANQKSVIDVRKGQALGKRVILKGVFIATMEGIYKELAAAQRKTKSCQSKRRKEKARAVLEESEIEVIEVLEDSETEDCEIQDCIAVQCS